MTVTWNLQYRPVSTAETATNDGLSVRAINDLADALNNYARYVGVCKVISEICIPHWQSKDSADTNENVIALFAPRKLSSTPNKFSVTAGHVRNAGAGSVQWRLYVSEWLYTGDVILDTSKLSPSYSGTSWTTSSGTHAISYTSDLAINLPFAYQRDMCFILTAQNTAGSRAELTSLDVTPRYI